MNNKKKYSSMKKETVIINVRRSSITVHTTKVWSFLLLKCCTLNPINKVCVPKFYIYFCTMLMEIMVANWWGDYWITIEIIILNLIKKVFYLNSWFDIKPIFDWVLILSMTHFVKIKYRMNNTWYYFTNTW